MHILLVCVSRMNLKQQQSTSSVSTAVKRYREWVLHCRVLVSGKDWMMFESPELNVVPFWIGRAMSKAEWDNCCWYKNKTPRRLRLAGDLPLDPGEYAINVQWYAERDVGSLEYIIYHDQPYPVVNNNRTLVMGGFEMIQSAGNLARVPRQRNVRQRNDVFKYAVPQLNLQTREGDWYRNEFGNVYKFTANDRDVGIARCGAWGGQG